MGKNLTKKEAEFCCLAAVLGNGAEAAYKAGFTVFPQKRAEKLKERNAKSKAALTGIRRIAFGSVADAVNLAVNFGENIDTHSLDLFAVSEIKYTAGKSVEIKFYDRLKALERLAEMESAEENAEAMSIYEAISNSARQADTYE